MNQISIKERLCLSIVWLVFSSVLTSYGYYHGQLTPIPNNLKSDGITTLFTGNRLEWLFYHYPIISAISIFTISGICTVLLMWDWTQFIVSKRTPYLTE